MMYDKKISVIMGVYNQNDKKILLDAVQSILHQSIDDFEFIIYNDGSEKQVYEYLKKIKDLDERIILIGAEKNNGLAFSLNECINIAKGEYIARMDADDISYPERFREQVMFLDKHKEYQWCGCNADIFDESGVWGERKMPECPDNADFLKYSPYIHPSVMYRAELFKNIGMYDDSVETLRCEDYEMFMRFHNMGIKGYNLQKTLFGYRENRKSYNKRKIKYRINEAKIRYRNFKKMKMLFPTGWMYVIRPIAGIIIPNQLIYKIKRRKDEKKKSDKNTEIQKNIIGGSDILTDGKEL